MKNLSLDFFSHPKTINDHSKQNKIEQRRETENNTREKITLIKLAKCKR